MILFKRGVSVSLRRKRGGDGGCAAYDATCIAACSRIPPSLSAAARCDAFVPAVMFVLTPPRSVSPFRSAGHLPQCRDHHGFPQGAGAEDPQQFPGVQFGHGRHWHLHERHRRRVLQLPEVSDVTAPVSQ